MKTLLLLVSLTLAGCYTQADYQRWLVLDAKAKEADRAATRCVQDPDCGVDRQVYMEMIAYDAHMLAYQAKPPAGGGDLAIDQIMLMSVMSH